MFFSVLHKTTGDSSGTELWFPRCQWKSSAISRQWEWPWKGDLFDGVSNIYTTTYCRWKISRSANHRLDGAFKTLVVLWKKTTNFPQLVSLRDFWLPSTVWCMCLGSVSFFGFFCLCLNRSHLEGYTWSFLTWKGLESSNFGRLQEVRQRLPAETPSFFVADSFVSLARTTFLIFSSRCSQWNFYV